MNPDLEARAPRCSLFDWHWVTRLCGVLLAAATAGCGNFVAHRMVQAPNSYPAWLAPKGPVLLHFEDDFLTNFPARFAEVGPPPARLHYRLVEPMDYQFGVTSTNWMKRSERRHQFTFRATIPAQTNAWTGQPRGTVVLLHGYGLDDFAMAPWAMKLAELGWRCLLVDLRGHGESTGDRIFFGLKETQDLSQLLDGLAEQRQLVQPVAAVGVSYGASLALRWKATEPRVGQLVAIAPYAVFSNAVLNICREYAPCLPRALPRAGLKRLPGLLEVAPLDLDTGTVLANHPIAALFVVGADDKITTPSDVRSLFQAAAPGSDFLVVPSATHETVPFLIVELVEPVATWLNCTSAAGR